MNTAAKIAGLTLAIVASAASAQRGGDKSDDRWNVTGPNWYETECGHIGFSATPGSPYQKWLKPCSVPIRVCECQKITINFPADPDVPCERMMSQDTAGPLQKSYLKRWD